MVQAIIGMNLRQPVVVVGWTMLAWGLAGGAASAKPAVSAGLATTTSGVVAGVTDGAIVSYKGLPYAAPPIGPLRWRSPEPPQAWKGIRRASSFGPPCAQPALRGRTEVSAISSEDCLYLNVWAPRGKSTSRLPVMVWIHGGAFLNGMGSSPTYDGAKLAAKGVVVVTINYRLGVFGFLAHPDLTAEAASRSSGNYGLEDQIAALRWVAANIRAFGGDPANVTIFGQSAGGASVMNLLVSRQTEGLFRRAIAQSGAARGAIGGMSLTAAERHGQTFARGASLAALRALDTRTVLEQAQQVAEAGVRFGLVNDGFVIDSDTETAFADPRRRKLPLLIGSNAREGLTVIPDDRLEAALAAEFGANAIKARAAYRLDQGAAADDAVMGTPAQQLSTDTSFRCGSVRLAQARAKTGAPTWQYQFEHFVPGREDQGAAHSFEVPYVFGNLSRTGFAAANYGPADRTLSDVLVGYWTNFAKRGDPNGPGLPLWPRYDPVGKSYQRLSSGFVGSAAPASDLRGEICQLLPNAPSSKE